MAITSFTIKSCNQSYLLSLLEVVIVTRLDRRNPFSQLSRVHYGSCVSFSALWWLNWRKSFILTINLFPLAFIENFLNYILIPIICSILLQSFGEGKDHILNSIFRESLFEEFKCFLYILNRLNSTSGVIYFDEAGGLWRGFGWAWGASLTLIFC